MAPPTGPRVVAIGDSITAGVGDSPVVGLSGLGWAAHVATALGASGFANFAANGIRARDMRQAQVPLALMEQPHVVLASIGGNDVLRGDFDPAQIEMDVRNAVMRLERQGRVIAFLSLDTIALFDIMPRTVAAVMARRIARTNEALARGVRGTTARLVSGADAMATAGTAGWHIDRVHPSPTGHRALATATLDCLADRFTPVASVVPAGPPPRARDQVWWLMRNGTPWVAKRSRDLIPQVAQLVTHELLEDRRARSQG